MTAKILVVEGHDYVRRALRGWLETMFPGCEVIETTSGEHAIIMVETSLPDVILIDVNLPGMNGLEATTRLKAIVPTTPVIVLTSYKVEAQYAHSITNGASAYVLKNDLTKLRSTLGTLIPPYQPVRYGQKKIPMR